MTIESNLQALTEAVKELTEVLRNRKVETPKVETPKVETPKVETPKVEAPTPKQPKFAKSKIFDADSPVVESEPGILVKREPVVEEVVPIVEESATIALDWTIEKFAALVKDSISKLNDEVVRGVLAKYGYKGGSLRQGFPAENFSTCAAELNGLIGGSND